MSCSTARGVSRCSWLRSPNGTAKPLRLRARLLVVLREVLHKPAKVNGHVFLHRKTTGRGTAGFRLRFHGKGLGFRDPIV